MKKIVCMLIYTTMIISLCACSNSEASAEKEVATEAATVEEAKSVPTVAEETEVKAGEVADAYTDATEYEITINDGQDITLSNVRFNKDLVITGSNGKVMFSDCEFNANIINKGGEGTKVMLLNNIHVYDGFKLVIDSEVKEGTMESDMPKFMIFSGNYPVECTNAGSVVSSANEEISFNGKKYSMDACDYYINESTGEFGEYAGQDASYHNICRWFENGEEVLMNFAIDE